MEIASCIRHRNRDPHFGVLEAAVIDFEGILHLVILKQGVREYLFIRNEEKAAAVLLKSLSPGYGLSDRRGKAGNKRGLETWHVFYDVGEC